MPEPGPRRPESQNEVLGGVVVSRRVVQAVPVLWRAVPAQARGAVVLALVMLAATVASIVVLLAVLKA